VAGERIIDGNLIAPDSARFEVSMAPAESVSQLDYELRMPKAVLNEMQEMLSTLRKVSYRT
jgi:hypothetical protein